MLDFVAQRRLQLQEALETVRLVRICLGIHLDPARFPAKPHNTAEQLAGMKPSIVVTDGASTIEMTAIDLQPGENKIVADALASVLMTHSV